jgi:type II secretion system protein I
VIQHERNKGFTASRQGCRGRRGFTLIELLVSLVLLDIGLLALVGLAASSSQNIDRLRGDARATSIATERLERLASTPCTATASGTHASSPADSEWFADQPSPNATRLLADSVRVTTSRGARVATLRTRARC